MSWNGVLTSEGNALIAQWSGGKVLTLTRAAAGTGRVSVEALMAQTALVNEKREISIVGNDTVKNGQRLKMHITPTTEKLTFHQIGVWGKLDDGEEKMIALFQTETDKGVDIPAVGEKPNFSYTYYGTLEFSNKGTLTVVFDTSALVNAKTLNEAIAEHDESENPHAGVLAPAVHGHTNQDITYPDDNDPKSIFRLGVENGKIYIQEVTA